MVTAPIVPRASHLISDPKSRSLTYRMVPSPLSISQRPQQQPQQAPQQPEQLLPLGSRHSPLRALASSHVTHTSSSVVMSVSGASSSTSSPLSASSSPSAHQARVSPPSDSAGPQFIRS